MNNFLKNLENLFSAFNKNVFQVDKYYEFTGDIDFLKKHVATLEKEFDYWNNNKTVNVIKNGKTYKMARYVTNSNGPRPESYK